MAEDITLKGVKVIRYNGEKTGDFQLVRPERGGDTHMLPKWWELKANNQVYLDCTVLEVGGNHLVIDTQMQSELRIIFDGTDITFPYFRGIERAALFPVGLYGYENVITDFKFPKIAVRGAKVAAIEGAGSGGGNTPTPPVDPCDGVTCPPGEVCENGVCVPETPFDDGGTDTTDSGDSGSILGWLHPLVAATDHHR